MLRRAQDSDSYRYGIRVGSRLVDGNTGFGLRQFGLVLDVLGGINGGQRNEVNIPNGLETVDAGIDFSTRK